MHVHVYHTPHYLSAFCIILHTRATSTTPVYTTLTLRYISEEICICFRCIGYGCPIQGYCIMHIEPELNISIVHEL